MSWLLAACMPVPGDRPPAGIAVQSDMAVTLAYHAFPDPPCTDSFVSHELPHTTTAPEFTVRGFESNGSGVAAGDLDQDGDLDLVLGGFAQPSTILWNEGNLHFEAQALGQGLVREVQLVDVDSDGWLDIATTRRGAGLSIWRNQPASARAGRFAPLVLSGVTRPLYSMDWADADGDGDLDLGGATYDAEMLDMFGSEFMMGDTAGVYIFQRQLESFHLVQLETAAQGLASLFMDLDGDRLPELLVGNDFAVPDMIFARTAGTWHPIHPFAVTTYSTMSLAAGDVNNDGFLDLYATDMKPPSQAPEVLAAWEPIMSSMMSDTMAEHDSGQLMENTLQLAAGADGTWTNAGADLALDATGWSWSGKFGDLDNDGWLDLYIVNGMMEEKIFSHLDRHELVEANFAFRNRGQALFEPAPYWNLGSRASGRGLVMADLDRDGDLDIAVNNMRGPAQLFENQLCAGHSLELDLYWPDTANTRAVGTRVTVTTAMGTIVRQVRVADGYLSGEPPRLHAGLGAESASVRVEIAWPDGLVTWLHAVPANGLVAVTRLE